MTLGHKLVLVFLAFLVLIGITIFMSFRERKAVRQIADDDLEAQRAADQRILGTIVLMMLGGVLLTLLTAWLVFF
jgi:hypothetical protein